MVTRFTLLCCCCCYACLVMDLDSCHAHTCRLTVPRLLLLLDYSCALPRMVRQLLCCHCCSLPHSWTTLPGCLTSVPFTACRRACTGASGRCYTAFLYVWMRIPPRSPLRSAPPPSYTAFLTVTVSPLPPAAFAPVPPFPPSAACTTRLPSPAPVCFCLAHCLLPRLWFGAILCTGCLRASGHRLTTTTLLPPVCWSSTFTTVPLLPAADTIYPLEPSADWAPVLTWNNARPLPAPPRACLFFRRARATLLLPSYGWACLPPLFYWIFAFCVLHARTENSHTIYNTYLCRLPRFCTWESGSLLGTRSPTNFSFIFIVCHFILEEHHLPALPYLLPLCSAPAGFAAFLLPFSSPSLLPVIPVFLDGMPTYLPITTARSCYATAAIFYSSATTNSYCRRLVILPMRFSHPAFAACRACRILPIYLLYFSDSLRYSDCLYRFPLPHRGRCLPFHCFACDSPPGFVLLHTCTCPFVGFHRCLPFSYGFWVPAIAATLPRVACLFCLPYGLLYMDAFPRLLFYTYLYAYSLRACLPCLRGVLAYGFFLQVCLGLPHAAVPCLGRLLTAHLRLLTRLQRTRLPLTHLPALVLLLGAAPYLVLFTGHLHIPPMRHARTGYLLFFTAGFLFLTGLRTRFTAATAHVCGCCAHTPSRRRAGFGGFWMIVYAP